MKPLVLHLLFCFFLLAFLPDAAAHEYYVSLCEFRYNEDSARFELSLRIFPDDMDRAIEENTGIRTALLTREEHALADSLLASYFSEKVDVQVNGTSLGFHYLGKEAESDAMWCYLETESCPMPEQLRIENSILTEVFDKQVNICQIYVGSQNRGLLLSRDQPSGELKLRTTSMGR